MCTMVLDVNECVLNQPEVLNECEEVYSAVKKADGKRQRRRPFLYGYRHMSSRLQHHSSGGRTASSKPHAEPGVANVDAQGQFQYHLHTVQGGTWFDSASSRPSRSLLITLKLCHHKTSAQANPMRVELHANHRNGEFLWSVLLAPFPCWLRFGNTWPGIDFRFMHPSLRWVETL